MLEWLAAEFERARERVRPSHDEWMERKGIGPAALAIAGGYGVARAILSPDGSWEPAEEGGDPVIVLPAWTPDGEGPRVLYDLVAFQPSGPDFPCWRRRLDAIWLGEDELALAAYWHLPITVRSSAMSWLRAGAKGAVILDWDRAIGRLFESPEVVGETEGLALRLRQELTRSLLERMPRIALLPAPPRPAIEDEDADLVFAA
ncbi:protein of unknown function (plasmid) [Magnetospirillum sp. XM-1]|uniref:hypothetical protein n=1 Tax=Magnetospirillum sp. XM-1 TaxID=1663591 RepID=UPI00073DE580|nr:hypothetical protein [Magnetospirillum sp. XM-1]CUW41876.1 protein of unknown function [Magnetospirillum sp. XM-1]